jgi:hypothetical protein
LVVYAVYNPKKCTLLACVRPGASPATDHPRGPVLTPHQQGRHATPARHSGTGRSADVVQGPRVRQHPASPSKAMSLRPHGLAARRSGQNNASLAGSWAACPVLGLPRPSEHLRDQHGRRHDAASRGEDVRTLRLDKESHWICWLI